MSLVRVKTSTWVQVALADDLAEQLALAVCVDEVHDLIDGVGGRGLRLDVDRRPDP